MKENNKLKIILGIILMTLIILCAIFIEKQDNNNNINLEDEIYSNIDIDNSKLNIFYFNVGQADSSLIMYEGKTILIDVGNDSDGEKILEFMKKKDIKKVDYLIGTHIHEDHIGGMVDIVGNIPIGQIFMPYNKSIETDFYKELLIDIEENDLEISLLNGDEKFIISKDMWFEVLFVDNTEPSNTNNASIVIQLTYKEQDYLFMGDSEKEVENKLLASERLKDIDVLKVGHHGSDTSSTENFINKILPDISIISVQKGTYKDMPNNDIIKILEDKGKVYRTDENGTIWITSDGISNIITELKELNLNGANKIGLRVYLKYARFFNVK